MRLLSKAASMGLISRSAAMTSLKLIASFLVVSVVIDFVSVLKAPATSRPTSVYEGHPSATIAKVSMLYGPPNPLYERALATHDVHNAKFGYPFFILREKMLPGFWSKPAYILRLLMSELEKPESQRLEWLVWVDGDTVIMNPNIPLDIFLPPAKDWEHIHAVMTNDHRGLNNGVFFLRIHPWSVSLMNACMNTPIHDPTVELEFEDQSALQYWLNKEEFMNNTVHVPQRWFNAYAGYRGSPHGLFADPLQPQYSVRPNSVKEGDLLVHHAGHKSLRAQRMVPWIETAERHLPTWELALESTNYTTEIADFWANEAKNERKVVAHMKKRVAEIAMKKAAAKEKAALEKQKEKEKEKVQENQKQRQQPKVKQIRQEPVPNIKAEGVPGKLRRARYSKVS